MIGPITRSGFSLALLVLWSFSVAATRQPFAGVIEHARYADAILLQGEVFHVQGVALDPQHIWITSVDGAHRRGYLHEFDRASGRVLRRIDVSDGPRYHAGGIALAQGTIWVPVAEPRAASSAVLLGIDAASLRVTRRIAVADHLGCVAVQGTTLVAGNWNSRQFHVIDLAQRGRDRVVANPFPTAYQDIKFVGHHLVAGGTQTLWSGTLDWIDWRRMTLERSLHASTLGPIRPFGRGGAFTGEGMAIEGRDVYLLPEDGPAHLFHFRLDSAPAA